MTIGARIREARKRLGMSQQALATEVGVSRPAVAQWESGESAPKKENIGPIAEALRTSVEWVLSGRNSKGTLMPVRGEVAAGVWREHIDLDLNPIPVAPDPRYPAEAQFALLVRGSSMDKLAKDGEYIHCLSVQESAIAPLNGDVVVVERRRHGSSETTVKRLVARRDGVRLMPESADPRYQEELEIGAVDDATEVSISAIVIGRYAQFARGR